MDGMALADVAHDKLKDLVKSASQRIKILKAGNTLSRFVISFESDFLCFEWILF